MKRRLYLLHRRLSIVIALPVLLWASSGLMHPVMTNIRPAVATQVYESVAIPSGRGWLSLDTVLRRRHIDSIAAVRLVHIDTNWFYQVRTVRGSEPVYLGCVNGKVLPMGDWLYAQWLARYFLEGGGSHGLGGRGDDCCGAATECVLHPAKGAAVSNVSLVSHFDDEYKSVNKLLPVWRVDFGRADGIRIYVETAQDRFSFVMDRQRALFDAFFRICHTWSWLDGLGKGKLLVISCVALTAFVTAGLGVWIFFVTRRRTRGVRRVHRVVSIVGVLFTLMWSGSGAYHAFQQVVEPQAPEVAPDRFVVAGLSPDWGRLQAAAGKPVTNFSVARIGRNIYWRTSLSGGALIYIHTGDYALLPDGDKEYARTLAVRYGGQAGAAKLLTAFDNEYNFAYKRLPVWKVSAGSGRVYVETGSGELAARVDNAVYAEGWSFAIFHKHHFMDWGGKKLRDASTMFWAFVQVVLVGIGLIFFFRSRK